MERTGEKMGLGGLSQINIELTSRCDKACSFCGHQDAEINKNLVYGDMDRLLLIRIAAQITKGIIVQFHRDGESLLYDELPLALALFEPHYITSIVTNGKKLMEKADQIIDHCTSLTVSAFHGDPDANEQLRILREFLRMKGKRKPYTQIKWVGDKYDPKQRDSLGYEYDNLGIPIIFRQLHNPDGNYHYSHRDPPIPEHGICLDFLHHPSVDWRGNLYICNRLSPTGEGRLGNLNEESLDSLWNGKLRLEWLEHHKAGNRKLASPLCHDCKFWGIPSA